MSKLEIIIKKINKLKIMGCSASKDAVTATPKTESTGANVAWNDDGGNKIVGGENTAEIKEGANKSASGIEWEDVALAKVATVGPKLNTAKQYCIMKLTNESAESFFSYQSAITHLEFHKEVIKTQLGRSTEEEAVEVLRA